MKWTYKKKKKRKGGENNYLNDVEIVFLFSSSFDYVFLNMKKLLVKTWKKKLNLRLKKLYNEVIMKWSINCLVNYCTFG